MSVNPYPNIPNSKGGVPMLNVAVVASVKAVRTLEQGTISSVYSMTHDTTFIEITSIGAPVAMRWVSVTDGTGVATSVITLQGTANYDHIIPAATYRQFAVPIETVYQAPSSMVGANRANGLYQRYAIKSLTAGSVMTTEY